MKSIIHLFIRLTFLVVPLWFLPEILKICLGQRTQNAPRCGMGDLVFLYLSIFCVFIFWAIGLSIEAFYLNKKGKEAERDINLVMSGIVFLFSILLFLIGMLM